MIITTAAAPAAIGPYVQGVNLGTMTMTSGQLPVNPQDGTMSDDIAQQTRQSLDNVKAIVEAAGLQVKNIVKTMVFVKDLNDFATINAVYEAFFTEHNAAFPARSCVEVARLPKDAGIEIEAIAVAGSPAGGHPPATSYPSPPPTFEVYPQRTLRAKYRHFFARNAEC